MTEEKLIPFTIFVYHNPPQRIVSTVNLIGVWQAALANRAETGEWWRPIEFVDDVGDVVAVYATGAIMGIVQGYIAPEGAKQ